MGACFSLKYEAAELSSEKMRKINSNAKKDPRRLFTVRGYNGESDRVAGVLDELDDVDVVHLRDVDAVHCLYAVAHVQTLTAFGRTVFNNFT